MQEDLAKYIEDYIKKGGAIKVIPCGQSGLTDSYISMYWIEEDSEELTDI